MSKKKQTKSQVFVERTQHFVWKKSKTSAAHDQIVRSTITKTGEKVEFRLTANGERVIRVSNDNAHMTQSQFQEIKNRKIRDAKQKSARRAKALWTPIVQGGSPGLKK
jgi:hypothetical protein